MSIRFPESNIATTTTGSTNIACGLDVPRPAFPKFVTAVDGIFGFLFRVPESIKLGNQRSYVFAHAAGTVRSSMLAVDLSKAPDVAIPLDCRIGFGGGATGNERLALNEQAWATVAPGRAYLYLVTYHRDTGTGDNHFHAVLCEVGSASPVIHKSTTTATQQGQYLSRTAAGDEIVQHVGTTSVDTEGFSGAVGEMFRLDGIFPHTGFVPDAAAIAAIADGSTPIDQLHTILSGSVQRISRHPLDGPGDLDNAWAGVSGSAGSNPMTLRQGDAAKLRELYHGPPLQPRGLTPPAHLEGVAGIASLDDTDAPMEIAGGSYDESLLSGTVAAVEARIVNATTGAALAGHDWFTLDAAPSGGSFGGGPAGSTTREGVPRDNAWYQVQYRLLDNGGAVLAAGTANALRGVGIRLVQTGQSVVARQWNTGEANGTGANIATPDNVRACWIYASPDPSRNDSPNHAIYASHLSPGVASRPGDGATTYMSEMALKAGCPVQVDLLAIQGHTLGTYLEDNDTEQDGDLSDPPDGYRVMSGFVADVAAATPPDRFIFIQMVQGDPSANDWKEKLEASLFNDPAQGWTGFLEDYDAGRMLFSMIGPGSRSASGNNQDVTQGKRIKTAEFIDEQASVKPGSSLLPMHLVDTAHPDTSAQGGRRWGAMMALGVLFNLRYPDGQQVTFKRALIDPADATRNRLKVAYLNKGLVRPTTLRRFMRNFETSGLAGRNWSTAMKVPGVDPDPPGVSFNHTDGVLYFGTPDVPLAGWDVSDYRVIFDAPRCTLRQSLLGSTAAANEAGWNWLVDVRKTADDTTLERCLITRPRAEPQYAAHLINQDFGPQDGTATAARRLRIIQCRFENIGTDTIKPVDATIEGCVFWRPCNLDGDAFIYDPAQTYNTGDLARSSNGTLAFRALQDGLTGSADAPPETATSDTKWQLRGWHFDIINVPAALGDGVKILNCVLDPGEGLFDVTGVNRPFWFQRNQGSTAPMGMVVAAGNVILGKQQYSQSGLIGIETATENWSGPIQIYDNFFVTPPNAPVIGDPVTANAVEWGTNLIVDDWDNPVVMQRPGGTTAISLTAAVPDLV